MSELLIIPSLDDLHADHIAAPSHPTESLSGAMGWYVARLEPMALYSSVLAQTLTDQSSILTRGPMDDYDLPDDIRDFLAEPSDEDPILTK